jgi:signal transduction histidine kinase
MAKLRSTLILGYGGLLLLSALALATIYIGDPRWALALIWLELVAGALFFFGVGRKVLGGLQRLSAQTGDVSAGRREACDLPQGSTELESVADSINSFAATVREQRQLEQQRLGRALQAARSVIDALPQAVALISLDGRVEIANRVAAKFGLHPGSGLGADVHKSITAIVEQALLGTDDDPTTRQGPARGAETMLQIFVDGNELFYLPHVQRVLDEKGGLIGVTLVLVDVTGERQLDEARSGLISAVSHQLKTPMTSIQMSIYLLLEDAIDRLTPRQAELLQAARDDSDRLHRLIEELLSTARETRSAGAAGAIGENRGAAAVRPAPSPLSPAPPDLADA